MDRPIGVFDSGIGGLTVVRQIINKLPNESIVYLGDTARVPYGNRDAETIKKYSVELVDFLNKKKVKAIVVACNTISAVALEEVKKASDVPVIDVISPTVEIVSKNFKGKKIAVVATRATVDSKIYEDKFNKHGIRITSTTAPLFVPLAEEGLLTGEIAKKIVGLYLGRLRADILILGSTHYPLLRSMIRDVLGSNTLLVDTGYAAALELAMVLKRNHLISKSKPSYEFYVTDDAKRTEQVAKIFFENELPARLEKIRL